MKTLDAFIFTFFLTLVTFAPFSAFGEVVEIKDIVNGWYQTDENPSRNFCLENNEDLSVVKIFVYDAEDEILLNKRLGMWSSSKSENLSFSWQIYSRRKMTHKNARVTLAQEGSVEAIEVFDYTTNGRTHKFTMTPNPDKVSPCAVEFCNLVASELQTIRSQVELYKVQHNDALPGTTSCGEVGQGQCSQDARVFPEIDGQPQNMSRLAFCTNVDGVIDPNSDFDNPSTNCSGMYQYGPYISSGTYLGLYKYNAADGAVSTDACGGDL